MLNDVVGLEVAILVRELSGVVRRLRIVGDEGLDDTGIALLDG